MSAITIGSPTRQAWITVLLLWPVALLNYLDRQIFATMKLSIMSGVPDIVTDQHFGDLMAVFLFVYGLFSPVGGYVADRFNRRWVIIVSLGVWSTITWLTGHATTYQQMWWARAIMGISEACYIPAALALIADFHHGGTRSRAVGIHQSGIYLGIIAGGLGGYIADSSYGWRAAFHWFGLAGVLYAAVLLLFLKNAPKNEREDDTSFRPGIVTSLRGLFGAWAFILLIFYFTLPAMPGWVVKSWMPDLLRETFNLGQGKAGVSATLWITLASLAGVLVGGTLADRWMKTNVRGHILVSAIGMAVCIPALFGIGYAPSLGVAVAFLILFGLGWGFFDANNMPILCQIVRPELRATGYGLMNMVSITVGGLAVKQVGAMRDAGSSQSLIFTVCGIAAAIAVVLVLLIRPRPATPAAE
ncbi:MFS transporter [Luteolibacter sp. LG18]|uniref:MFS transporter n=1 Tax=Luteolibacter sp. LG18 TaxID=2819286 RepID=UPI002B2B9639|nr:MFS transporter [Luteolibacter sp. LG18]